jgi:hypothetical protein
LTLYRDEYPQAFPNIEKSSANFEKRRKILAASLLLILFSRRIERKGNHLVSRCLLAFIFGRKLKENGEKAFPAQGLKLGGLLYF